MSREEWITMRKGIGCIPFFCRKVEIHKSTNAKKAFPTERINVIMNGIICSDSGKGEKKWQNVNCAAEKSVMDVVLCAGGSIRIRRNIC